MKKERQDGLYLLILGSLVLLLLGTVLANTSPVAMGDFRGLYYPAHCLIQHCDPYLESDVARVVESEEGGRAWDSEHASHFTRYVYFPSAFSFTVPFAMLPWGPAHILWMTLSAGSLIFASFLIWKLGANYSPIVSGALVGLLLAGSELVLVFGNVAGIAISLCVLAVCCFLLERFVLVGVLCLAISLALKPQDAGLVWLYFLLAGGLYRRRALQTLGATIALSLPAVLWVYCVSPHWMKELRSNVVAFSAPGGIMDPGLASKGVYGLGLLISLQTVVSFFRDDPQIYNLASSLVCAPLLAIWAFSTLRSRSSPARVWLSLAAIAVLSLLPVYHRQNDAKILLLTVPACAMLWAEGGSTGWIAFGLNLVGFVLTGDLPWTILLALISSLHLSTTGLSGQVLTLVQVFSIPLTLLVMGVFYLWVYVRRSSGDAPTSFAAGPF